MRHISHTFRSHLAVASVLVGNFVGIAHAEVLNIPVSAGMAVESAQCFFDPGIGLGSPQSVCNFEIPISIPAGHTIQQINAVHSTTSFLPSPFVSVALLSSATSGPVNANEQFYWSSSDYVPDNTIQSTHLMGQFGKNFPDAFVVQANTLYRAEVSISGAAFVTGIEVIYQ